MSLLRSSLLTPVVRRIYPYGAVRKVLVGPLQGQRYIVAPGMGVSYGLGRGLDGGHGDFLKNRISDGMTVYDIGANRGQMALLFARLVGKNGQVIAFEPVPDIYAVLKRNIALNELANVHCREAAVCDHNGTKRFAFTKDASTQGKMVDCEMTYLVNDAIELEVNSLTLDSLHERAPDVLKIDVEGGAAQVFRGARKLLESHRPTIYIELHGPEEQAGVRDELMNRGYRISTLDGQVVTDPVAQWHSPLWCEPES